MSCQKSYLPSFPAPSKKPDWYPIFQQHPSLTVERPPSGSTVGYYAVKTFLYQLNLEFKYFCVPKYTGTRNGKNYISFSSALRSALFVFVI